VTITVSNDLLNIAGAKLTVGYDPAVLSFTATDANAAVTVGDVIASPLKSVNASTPGTVIIGLVSTTNSTKGGTIASFPLTVNAGIAPTRTSITLAAELNDSNANTVSGTVGNGVATIGNCAGGTTTAGTTTATTTTGTTTTGTTTATTTTGTTTATTTAGTTTGGVANSGDTNGDGKVDVDDVHSSIDVLFGINTDAAAKAAADVNADGTVDLRDVRMLLQFVVNGTWPPGSTTGGTTTTGGATTATTTTGTGTTTTGTTTATTTTGTTTTGTTTTGGTTTGTTTTGTTTEGTTTTGGTTTAGTTTGTTTTTGGTTTGTTTSGPAPAFTPGQVFIGDLSGAKGATITVPVNFDNTLLGVAGAKITLTYDPAQLTFTATDANAAVTVGDVIASPLKSVNASTPGTIIIGLVSTTNSTKGGMLLSLPLTIAANATAPWSEIKVAAELNDSNANTVNATVGNGIVTIQ